MKHSTFPQLAALALSAGLLSACGGGGGGGGEEPPVAVTDTVPAAIATSVDALLNFASGVASNDTAEPLLLGSVVPATDDTAEPAGL